jgi:excisionase family DNA binding protein
MNNEETLSIKETQVKMGVSRRTLYNWMNAGKVKFIRTAGGAPRILASSLFRAGNVTPATES